MCLGALCVLLAPDAHADTVWMKNGDRLTGRVTQLEAGKLILVTGYGGTMQLDWSQVKAVDSASDVQIPNEAMRRDYLARLRGADEVAILSVPGVPLNEPGAPEPIAEQSLALGDVVWKGNLDLGLNHKTASTRTEDYAAKLDGELRQGRWRHKIDAGYMRNTDNSVTTSHHYGASLSSDRFMSEQFFWQGRAFYRWDGIEELSRQMAVGAGPGYQFWDDETGAFSLAGLVGRGRYNYSDGASEGFYAVSLRWDYNRYLGDKRFELFASGELLRPLNNAANVSLDAIVGVRYRMTDWVSWFLSYSRNQVRGGRQSLNEKRLSTGLGLTW